MKKYLVYMTCAAAAMIGGTGCSDFGDVNMDPEHLNSENIPTELLFTNGQHQMLGSDWDVWRNGCIYAAQWMSIPHRSIGWVMQITLGTTATQVRIGKSTTVTRAGRSAT